MSSGVYSINWWGKLLLTSSCFHSLNSQSCKNQFSSCWISPSYFFDHILLCMVLQQNYFKKKTCFLIFSLMTINKDKKTQQDNWKNLNWRLKITCLSTAQDLRTFWRVPTVDEELMSTRQKVLDMIELLNNLLSRMIAQIFNHQFSHLRIYTIK